MSTKMEENIKRWTAERKSALVLDIIQCRGNRRQASEGGVFARSGVGYRCAVNPHNEEPG